MRQISVKFDENEFQKDLYISKLELSYKNGMEHIRNYVQISATNLQGQSIETSTSYVFQHSKKNDKICFENVEILVTKNNL